jgi:hypothetical protein
LENEEHVADVLVEASYLLDFSGASKADDEIALFR